MKVPVLPVVSVVIPTYNRANFLRRAIQSVLDQNYTNLEVIVVDNYSDDDTDMVVGSFKDSRISYLKINNSGVIAASRIMGINAAKGDLIAFLDSDDWWENDKLEKQVPLFNDEDVGMVYGNFWLVDEPNRSSKKKAHHGILPEGLALNELLDEYVVGMLTLIVRRSALESLEQIFDSRYNIISDFDLVIRLATKWKLACVQKPVANYRFHGGNLSLIEAGKGLSELEAWYLAMSHHPIIGYQSRFACRRRAITYMKIMQFIMQGERILAFYSFLSYPLCPRKLRLLIALIMPLPILKIFRR